MERIIYLDNAATTFPKPECVYEKMDFINRNLAVNSGRGSYKLSRLASEIIKECRENIASLLNIQNSNKVIYTPSATIAINQILGGINWGCVNNIYVSPFEHNAIMRTLHLLQKEYNFEINIIPFDPTTFRLDERKLKILVAEKKADVIMLSHISNVTGFILPIKRIYEIAKDEDTITVIDASQSAGLVNLEVNDYDFLVFAGHKTLYGPFGIAGFIKNTNIELNEFIVGGTGSDSKNLEMPSELPGRYEAGSYNIQAIAGLNESIKWIRSNGIENIKIKEQKLTEFLVKELQLIDELEIYVPEDSKEHIGIVSFNVDGFDASEFADILDEEFNISVRAGHHCAPNIGEFLGGQAEEGLIRVSLSYFSGREDIIALKDAIIDIVRG